MSLIHLNLSDPTESSNISFNTPSALPKSSGDDQLTSAVNSSQLVQHTYIHPVVLFSILDHYLRRNATQDNVIGTLLGVLGDDGRIVEVRSCYAVPHYENETEVEMDMEYHGQMYKLHNRVNQKEVVVGWYSTGLKISKYAPLIHDFYVKAAKASKVPSPVYLLVDTELTGNKLGISAYGSLPVGTDKNSENALFLPVPYSIHYPNAERNALDTISKAKDDGADGIASLVTDIEKFEASIEELIQMLDRVSKYVQSVCDGKVDPDNAVGRYLSDTLSCIPKVDPDNLDALFQSHLQDLLMIVYLSNLTRVQLNISDRLQRIA
ncbi:hypothetical protein H4219_005581 [Mycoemilia scoparia]|uniref:Eukaryotic translation initiation factor 3 subunit F n=1 Tax=Mycoemilia scoparia TaxID=417184 RepID=A0A9W8DKU0_9FUNG|nr:hypothetical protein H4219_005581 [Mycoemilia scoparia]